MFNKKYAETAEEVANLDFIAYCDEYGISPTSTDGQEIEGAISFAKDVAEAVAAGEEAENELLAKLSPKSQYANLRDQAAWFERLFII